MKINLENYDFKNVNNISLKLTNEKDIKRFVNDFDIKVKFEEFKIIFLSKFKYDHYNIENNRLTLYSNNFIFNQNPYYIVYNINQIYLDENLLAVIENNNSFFKNDIYIALIENKSIFNKLKMELII